MTTKVLNSPHGKGQVLADKPSHVAGDIHPSSQMFKKLRPSTRWAPSLAPIPEHGVTGHLQSPPLTAKSLHVKSLPDDRNLDGLSVRKLIRDETIDVDVSKSSDSDIADNDSGYLGNQNEPTPSKVDNPRPKRKGQLDTDKKKLLGPSVRNKPLASRRPVRHRSDSLPGFEKKPKLHSDHRIISRDDIGIKSKGHQLSEPVLDDQLNEPIGPGDNSGDEPQLMHNAPVKKQRKVDPKLVKELGQQSRPNVNAEHGHQVNQKLPDVIVPKSNDLSNERSESQDDSSDEPPIVPNAPVNEQQKIKPNLVNESAKRSGLREDAKLDHGVNQLLRDNVEHNSDNQLHVLSELDYESDDEPPIEPNPSENDVQQNDVQRPRRDPDLSSSSLKQQQRNIFKGHWSTGNNRDRYRGRNKKNWAGDKYTLEAAAKWSETALQSSVIDKQGGRWNLPKKDPISGDDNKNSTAYKYDKKIEDNKAFLNATVAITAVSDVAAVFGFMEYVGDLAALGKERAELNDAKKFQKEYQDLYSQLQQARSEERRTRRTGRHDAAAAKLEKINTRLNAAYGRYLGAINKAKPNLWKDLEVASHRWKVYGGLVKYTDKTVAAVEHVCMAIGNGKKGYVSASLSSDLGKAIGGKAGDVVKEAIKFGVEASVAGILFNSASAVYYGAKGVQDCKNYKKLGRINDQINKGPIANDDNNGQGGIKSRLSPSASKDLKNAIDRIDRKTSKKLATLTGRKGKAISAAGNLSRSFSAIWGVVSSAFSTMAAGAAGIVAAPTLVGGSMGAAIGAAIGNKLGNTKKGALIGAAVGSVLGTAAGVAALVLAKAAIIAAAAGAAAFMATPPGIAIGAIAATCASAAYIYKGIRHLRSSGQKNQRKAVLEATQQMHKMVKDASVSGGNVLKRHPINEKSLLVDAAHRYNKDKTPDRHINAQNMSVRDLRTLGLVKSWPNPSDPNSQPTFNLAKLDGTVGIGLVKSRAIQNTYDKIKANGGAIDDQTDITDMSYDETVEFFNQARGDLISRDSQAACEVLYDQLIDEYMEQQENRQNLPQGYVHRTRADIRNNRPRIPSAYRKPTSPEYRNNQKIKNVADLLTDMGIKDDQIRGIIASRVDLQTGQPLDPNIVSNNDQKANQKAAIDLLKKGLALK